jgi:hypothetical protein
VAEDMRRTLIKSATIVSMDAQLGDLVPAIFWSKAIGSSAVDLGSGAAQSEMWMDRSHYHSRANQRAYAPGDDTARLRVKLDAAQYFRRMHAGLATLLRPDDIHIATLVGAEQINCQYHHVGRLVPQQSDA